MNPLRIGNFEHTPRDVCSGCADGPRGWRCVTCSGCERCCRCEGRMQLASEDQEKAIILFCFALMKLEESQLLTDEQVAKINDLASSFSEFNMAAVRHKPI